MSSRPPVRLRRALAALLPLLAFAPAEVRAQLPVREVEARVDSIARASLRGVGVGLSVAVARGDSLLLVRGYGTADVENGVPVTERSVFPIGSVTKQITAAAVLQLAAGGRLSLDDSLARHLPGWPAAGRGVTLRHLLAQTSGIPSFTDDPGWAAQVTVDRTPDQVLALFRDRPLQFEPGTRWAYSNSGYYLLGRVVEAAAGVPWEAYVRDRISAPRGLGSLAPCDPRTVLPHRVRGYTVEEGVLRNVPPMSTTQSGAAGALCATAADLVRWSRALHAGGLLPDSLRREMLRPAATGDGKPTRYGFGVMVDSLAGEPRLHHGGGVPGGLAHLSYYPRHDLTVAVLSNSDVLSADRVEERVARALLGIAEAERRDLPVAAEERRALAGTYDLGPLRLRVFERERVLLAQGTGQPAFRLLRQEGDAFLLDLPDQEIRIEFVREGGRVAALTLHQGGRAMRAARVP